MFWDLFVRVIDNHGDIGVCWRLATELAARGDRVRLWVDDASALAWMAPRGHPAVELVAWTDPAPDLEPAEAVIESFGCELPSTYQAALARASAQRGRQPAWINLEYLSAEPYVERSHGLPSPMLQGPAAGLTKRFVYPGFTPNTGGLLREHDLAARQGAFDAAAWLRALGIDRVAGRIVSLFCYEPPALADLLAAWAAGPAQTQLLVTAGRAQAACEAAVSSLDRASGGWNAAGNLRVLPLPLLSQRDYDHLLWSCDLNFVRGEDSLVRALWAGKPFVWQIYPQHDDAHHAKLEAFLAWLGAGSELREFFLAWNGIPGGRPSLPPEAPWAALVLAARARALALPELAATLQRFVLERGRI